MKIWFQIGSDLIVNLTAGIIILVFVEQYFGGKLPTLTSGIIVVIVSLVFAKKFKEEGNKS